MTLARSAFGGAFLLIIAGSLAARSAVAPLFHGLGSSGPRSVLAARDTPKASPSLIVISPAHPSPGSTTPSPVERRRIGRPAPTPTPPATLRPTSKPAPSATPASGTLALLRYWVGTPGTTRSNHRSWLRDRQRDRPDDARGARRVPQVQPRPELGYQRSQRSRSRRRRYRAARHQHPHSILHASAWLAPRLVRRRLGIA